MKKLFSFSEYQYKSLIQYKFNSIMQIIASLIMVIIQYCIWMYVDKYNSIDINDIVSYILIAILVQQLLPINQTIYFVSNKILKGNIVNYLNKPISLIAITFFTSLGSFFYKLIYQVFPIIIVYVIFFHDLFLHRYTLKNIFIFLVSYILSYFLAFLLAYSVSLVSILFIKVSGISNLLNSLIIIFGGGLLPIDLYPQKLIEISSITPFYSIMYTPISILNNSNTNNIVDMFGLQILWILVFMIVVYLLDKAIRDKQNILGG